MTKQYNTDVAIIGAGPVGLFAIFECGMVGLNCHVIDALEEIGGQCTALYPEKPIYDIAGLPNVRAGDLIANLEKQSAPYKPTYHLGQSVDSLTEKDGTFTLTTSKGTQIQARAVIIAGGAGAFGPNRPPIEGLENFEGTSVFYAIRNKEQFRDKNVIIAGGGDSALDWTIALEPIAKSVTIVHRREKFRGAPDSVSKLHALADAEKITLQTPYQLKSIAGQNGQVETVTVADLDGETVDLNADALLCFFGLATSLGAISEWGIDIEKKELRINQETSETSLSGVYAVGDIATYPHKLKLILTGFAECAQAAHSIYDRINPDKPLHFEYSTTKGTPK
ncbi:MAG: NAD(P)/FAD-dependent oxidoreductase [Alphaproteobacteria bacterium]|nr:NAD(P)/FAD-dependent oxidoreductase [Alphaproteobacteria bacterium]